MNQACLKFRSCHTLVSKSLSQGICTSSCFVGAGILPVFIYDECTMDYIEYFKGKRVTLMRIGLLGRGVGDAAFLAESGAEVHVVDDAPQEVMQPSVDVLKRYSNIRFTFGSYQTEHFTETDMVLVGAGAQQELPVLVAARDAGVELAMSAALFAKLSGIPIIGVTGTRGKSTVTHIIHHVLSQETDGGSVLLGGNVRGVSNLQLLKEVQNNSIAVMELDSWQLQGFGWAEISPHIAVFTNFMEDHLNYYQVGERSKEEALRRYFEDKANIFRYQEESGVLVTTPEVFELAKQLKGVTLGQEVVLADASILPEDMLLATPGEHNRLNAALAYEALKATSLTDEEIFEGLATFPGISGRLEYLGERGGVKIYNDNNATTPQATVQGLKAVGGDHTEVLIIGGTDKKIDFGELPEQIKKHCAHVVLYSGTGTEKLKAVLDPSVSTEEHDTLRACVEAALATAASGDVILFSPAFSSFGKEYKNEYDRNDQFVALIKKYETS